MTSSRQTLIVENRRARFDFFIEETYSAGIALLGWETKSLRARRAQLVGSFVLARPTGAVLHDALITPLPCAMPPTEPRRPRQLLLQRHELRRLALATRQRGYTCVCLEMHWQRHWVKCTIGLARGKERRDRRATVRQREWDRQQHRVLRPRATGR